MNIEEYDRHADKESREIERADYEDTIKALKQDLKISHQMIADLEKEIAPLRRLKGLVSQNQPLQVGKTLIYANYDDYLLSLDNTDKSGQT